MNKRSVIIDFIAIIAWLIVMVLVFNNEDIAYLKSIAFTSIFLVIIKTVETMILRMTRED